MSVQFLRLCLILLLAGLCAPRVESAPLRKQAAQSRGVAFHEFIASIWPMARARGVTRGTFDFALNRTAFDPKVVANAANQPEFSLPIWSYLKTTVSTARIRRGREVAKLAKRWLEKAQESYHVDPAVIMGVWGVETEFGAFTGQYSTVQSLASLAFVHFRGDYFRDELLDALVILQAGDVAPKGMRGSWAGAMGQTQFMPSSFLAYAVDFEGHGRRDIWGSEGDAIGSTACFLAAHGWKPELPWGFEIRLPKTFALSNADSSKPQPFSELRDRGVVRLDGEAWPIAGEGRLLILSGLNGPILVVTSNFDVIKSYNPSTSYALAVGLLGDSIMSGAALKTNWPSKDRPLAAGEVRRLQTRLKHLGYDIGEVDGKAGDVLRSAVRAYQERKGLAPDGYPDVSLLKRVIAEK